jgi:hypothetical protein
LYLTSPTARTCPTYFDARAFHRRPVSDPQLVAAVIVAAIAGHPDADEQRAGTEPSAVWAHPLAVVLGDDPRWVAKTCAPTETKRISHRIQHFAARGVEVVRVRGADDRRNES